MPESRSNETVPEVVTTSGYALLHFFSDAAYNLTGFNIAYAYVCKFKCFQPCLCSSLRKDLEDGSDWWEEYMEIIPLQRVLALWRLSGDLFFHVTFKNSDVTSDTENITPWQRDRCARYDAPLNRDRLNSGEEWRQVQSHSLRGFWAHTSSADGEEKWLSWQLMSRLKNIYIFFFFFGKWKVIILSLTPSFLSIIWKTKHYYFCFLLI